MEICTEARCSNCQLTINETQTPKQRREAVKKYMPLILVDSSVYENLDGVKRGKENVLERTCSAKDEPYQVRIFSSKDVCIRPEEFKPKTN